MHRDNRGIQIRFRQLLAYLRRILPVQHRIALVVAVAVAGMGLLLTHISLASAPAPAVTSTPQPFTVSGLDLHDGMIAKFGSTYYLYGTEYKCGFSWGTANTTFCGFGVSTASSLSGPWSAPTLLFQPTDPDPYDSGHDYNWLCGSTGQGCFNPRMIQRSGWGLNDGTFILWFNAPLAYSKGATSAYYVMGCNGPAGPCGATAGAPHGSTHRPTVDQCKGANGDFALVSPTDGTASVLICTMAGTTGLGEEQLDKNGANGDGTGATNIGGLSNVEGPGAYQDPATGKWILTYSDPKCGYCAGTGTGYAIATSLLGPWTAPPNVGTAAPVTGRRDITASSCGGQPRTISRVDGQAWQGVDLWTGATNEKNAGLLFEPLTYTAAVSGAPGSGTVWQPPFGPWSCL